eukprot:evm.model.scf_4619.1 EVM.evm.TU.scf_4619.1   scf_4619:2437-3896(+)
MGGPSMSTSVLEELEGLRKLMAPRRGPPSSPQGKPSHLIRSYSQALATAEHSVDRLSRAMEAAEDEMETALKRTGEVQKSQVARKDLEVQELRRVVSSKEKSIDGLRETLAATKRSLEARLLAMETTVAARDAEVRQLQEGLVTVKAERDHLQYELQQEVLRTSRVDKEHQGREEDMAGALNALQENMSQAEASLRQERKAK